ncbi:MAG: hypothetical protein DRN00_04170 [Thermoplasmata archaeon]|nr:MAG: hypothetical protein DRN00_04170 [Thermoplasmata archaeon]
MRKGLFAVVAVAILILPLFGAWIAKAPGIDDDDDDEKPVSLKCRICKGIYDIIYFGIGRLLCGKLSRKFFEWIGCPELPDNIFWCITQVVTGFLDPLCGDCGKRKVPNK